MPNFSKADKAAEISASEARRRKEVALARLREMEVAQRARLLLPAEEVRTAWVEVGGKIKDAVLRIPDKLAPAVAAAADVREVRAILLAECESILRTLHDDILHAGF